MSSKQTHNRKDSGTSVHTEIFSVPFAQSADASSQQSTMTAIATAIANSPVLGAAQVIAGIYGAYSSYEMGQAIDQIGVQPTF